MAAVPAKDSGATLSLFAAWKERRDELRPFGQVCAMARDGKLPGLVNVAGERTPRVLISQLSKALSAMARAT